MGAPDASPSKPPTADEQLFGLKYIKTLDKHCKRLRRCAAHPNRVRHFDDLRTLEDASQSVRLQDCLSIEKVCRSTLSDANACLDASLLEPLIADLRRRVPHLSQTDRPLDQLFKRAVAVDGSFFSVAANVAWALRKRKPWDDRTDDHFVRLDLQYCCRDGTMHALEINGRGTSETTAAARHIEPGKLYIADRGIFSFRYIGQLLAGRADFVLRIKTSQRLEVVRELPLSPQQKAAGVVSDRVVVLAPSSDYQQAPTQELREVVVIDERHPDRPVRLLTNLTDVPASVVGEAYRWRWQIELFFR